MSTRPFPANRQVTHVALALLTGILFGSLLHFALDPSQLKPWLTIFSALTESFLRLIKMIIAPLVFATLVVGIAKIGDIHQVGRIGLKAIFWFFFASLFSLILGMLLVNLFEPGVHLQLVIPANDSKIELPTTAPTLNHFISHLFPKSIIEAMANNEILQIVIFSLFFGTACAALNDLAHPTVKLLDSLSHIMLKITGYIMHAAPVAVFSSVVTVIAQQGLSVLWTYSQLLAEFYLGLVLLCMFLSIIGFLALGQRMISLIRHIREPMLLAFGTASSESAYPKLLQQLERFGCDEKICGLVLPLGYSFNLDGSMMYMTFATLFIAQAYGIHLPATDQLLMLLVLLFTSKGVAGVPRASLIVISATLGLFNIPEAGLLLILAIDQFLDMGRSATNVFGNSIASVLISRWEKALR